MGAQGAIGGTYSAMPDLFLKMDELISGGRLEEARRLQYEVNSVIYKMCSARGNMYGVIKEILKLNHGLELGGVRSPLPSLEESDGEIVREAARMIQCIREKHL